MKQLVRYRTGVSVLILLSLISTIACGGLLDSIRSGWAGTKPFIQSLVAAGTISQAKADAAIRDVDDTLAKADIAEQCVDAIPSDLNKTARKIAKGKCYFEFAQNFRMILGRHNIGGSPMLDRIALIGEGFIVALEQYFRRVSGSATLAEAVSDPDEALEDDIDAHLKELKAATKQR